MTRNEAAERLRLYAENVQRILHPVPRQPTQAHVCKEPESCDLILEIPQHVKDIRAEERRHVIEQIRERFNHARIDRDADVFAILDELSTLVEYETVVREVEPMVLTAEPCKHGREGFCGDCESGTDPATERYNMDFETPDEPRNEAAERLRPFLKNPVTPNVPSELQVALDAALAKERTLARRHVIEQIRERMPAIGYRLAAILDDLSNDR